MGTIRKYALWNNKGGVGKTFLTFSLATRYATENPDSIVTVIDMCPQANISEIMLGGNGTGTENLSKLIGCGETIGNYFNERIASPHRPTGTEYSHALFASQENKNIPENILLIPGDPSLELQVQTETVALTNLSLCGGVETVLNRSLMLINSLIPCAFALHQSQIFAYAMVSR